MSRKTVRWRKKIGSTFKTGGKHGKERRCGNGGSVDGLIPANHIKGKDHQTITLPMSPEKEARVRKLVPTGGKR